MSNLLRISDAASLALHTMVFLTGNPDRWVSTHEIASFLCVSEHHLSKVCQRLSKVGLVETIRGPKGGVRLGRLPEEITLREIYESIDGPLKPTTCLLGRQACIKGQCVLGGLLEKVNREVTEHFTKTTLAQLSGER